MTHMLKTNDKPQWVEWEKKGIIRSEPNFNNWVFHGDCKECNAFNMYTLISKRDRRGAERHEVYCRSCGALQNGNVEIYEKPKD